MKKKKLRNKALTEEVRIYLNDYIKSLNLKENNKLPSEEVLAELMGVSRTTIRAVLNEMAAEGIVFRKQGKGTFVNIEALEMKVKFNPVMEFKDMIINSGYKPDVKLLGMKVVKPSRLICEKLGISEKKDIIVARKIFYADQIPCAYCVDYFGKDIIGSASDEDYLKYPNSIFEYILEKSGKRVTWDKVEILTRTNLDNPELTEVFKLGEKVKAFLLLRGVNFDDNDEPLLYAEEYIDTDFIKFNMIRQRCINY